MRWPVSRIARRRLFFGLAAATIIGIEAYVILIARDGRFEIKGEQHYEIAEFSTGSTVTHAFLMRGDGLHSISVHLETTAPSSVRVRWTLWHGYLEAFRQEMPRAFEGETTASIMPGGRWVTWDVTRDGSSDNRWYTLDVQLLSAVAAGPGPEPQVSVVATRDNPERGGILFVNGVRQPGSLWLRADRRGRTIYRRFVAEAEPNLPAVLRIEAVQWLLVVVLHWAFFTFAYALLVSPMTSRGATDL